MQYLLERTYRHQNINEVSIGKTLTTARRALNSNKVSRRINTSNAGVAVFNAGERAKVSGKKFIRSAKRHPIVTGAQAALVTTAYVAPVPMTGTASLFVAKSMNRLKTASGRKAAKETTIKMAKSPIKTVSRAVTGASRAIFTKKPNAKSTKQQVRDIAKTVVDLPKQSKTIPRRMEKYI